MIDDPIRPITLLSNGVSNAPFVIYRISNGHISVTGRPIHFMFRSRVFGVGGSNSAISSSVKPKMAASLRFAARTSVSMQIYNGIARFTCESTCFLYYFLNLLITLINHTSWTRRPHSFISFITVKSIFRETEVGHFALQCNISSNPGGQL